MYCFSKFASLPLSLAKMVNLHSSLVASNVLPNVDRALIQYQLEFNAPSAIKVTHFGKGYPRVINVRVLA